MCAQYFYRLNSGIYHALCRFIFISSLITAFLFTIIPTKDHIEPSLTSIKTKSGSHNTLKLSISANDTKLLPFISIMTENVFHRDSCRIEVFGGFDNIEQAYVSGVLFRDIPQTCSCYLHYQPIEKFSITEHEPIESISNKSLSIARILWCVLKCPDDVIQWCRKKAHRLYCRKYVILFDLFDENLDFGIGHYPSFAAVYRNYLRHDTGNYLTYLTKDIRQLSEVEDFKYIHRILNWTLAINIMQEEWQNVRLNVSSFSNKPTEDVLNQINNRIIKRLLINNEHISYHVWPNLDLEIRKSATKTVPVFWFPIGFGISYLYNTAQYSVVPTSQRKKLWTWFGSMKENERTDMVKRFALNDTLADHISQRGNLTVTGTPTGGFLLHMAYISELLDSQFIPLPRGYSPEQYRVYEAVESGAIPIVNEHWLKIKEDFVLEPLAYLNILGYDPPTLTNFSNLPEKLLELSRLPLDLLDHWQSIMLIRHRMIIHTLSKHIAKVVCATTTLDGYVHQEDQN